MLSHKVTLSTLPPEVLTMILSQLTRHHLTVGVRVCKEWATLMNSILWETISIRTPIEFHRHKDSDYKAGLIRNGQWIRTLDLKYYSLVHDFASAWVKKDVVDRVQQGNEIKLACTRLWHLAVESQCDPSPPPQPRQPFHAVGDLIAKPLIPEVPPLPELDSRPLVELIRVNRTLKTLKLSGRLIAEAKGSVVLGQVLNSCRQSCEATFERLQLEFYVPYRLGHVGEVPEEVGKDAKDDGEDSREEKTEKGEDGDIEGVEKRAVMSAFKTLSIFGGVIADNSSLVTFLKACPALESVGFWSMSDSNFMRFPPVLQKFCPQLKHLQMESPLKDSELAALLACNVDSPRQESWAVSEHGTKGDLRSSPASSLASWSGRGWRTVKIPWADESFGPFSLQALKLHYSTLESLQIEGCDNFKSKDVQDLLCSSPRLKHLHAMTSGEIYTPKNVVLDARDIAESTRKWACAETLLTLEVIINNIPRPDVLKNHNGRPLTDQPLHDSKIYNMQDSYELQRAVYAQLGEMTKLRVLVLGHDDTDTGNEMMDSKDIEDGYNEGDGTIVQGYQYECLSFTLESGMDLLKGLKDLWRLDLKRMAVGLGGKERKWMREHWPKWPRRVRKVRISVNKG